MITQEQVDAAWEVHGGGDAYEAFANGMRCGADLEREACAQINMNKSLRVADEAKQAQEEGDAEAATASHAMAWVLICCAAVIRARGATDGNVKA